MKYLLIIVLLAGSALTGRGQDTAIRLVQTITRPVTDAALDNLGNLYLLTAGDQLVKLGEKGDSIASYNNVRRFGKVHSLDVSNPLRLLLFYKDFSTVVILDRFLSARRSLDLRRHNILQAGAVGLSYDNNIWLFDEYANRLKKVNEEGSLLLETPDFRMLFSEPVSPQVIIDQDNLLYLYDTARGVYVFDHFGTFKRKLPVAHWQSIRIADPYILGIDGDGLQAYNSRTLLQYRRPLPPTLRSFGRFILGHNRLVAIGKDSLQIYSYKF